MLRKTKTEIIAQCDKCGSTQKAPKDQKFQLDDSGWQIVKQTCLCYKCQADSAIQDLKQFDENGNYRYTAVVLPTIFGDGKQLIYLGAKNQRLVWYIRVDSNDDMDDYHKPIEKVLEALILHYGLWDEEDYTDEEDVELKSYNDRNYPMVPDDIFDAYFWGKAEQTTAQPA